MISDKPQPGDKVRVTSIVDKNGRYGGIMSVEDGAFGATLEILERANDPRHDALGTWRQDVLGRLYYKVEFNIWRKMDVPDTFPDTFPDDRLTGTTKRVKISVTDD